MKIVVLDGHTVNPNDLSWDSLKSLGEIEIYPRSNEEEVISRSKEAEAILINKVIITEDIISKLPKLRYIGLLATGYDNIDLQATKANNIVVTNIPAYGTPSVAQHTFALILELTNRVGLHHKSVLESEWERGEDFSYFKAPLTELFGKTMGILGYGQIGQQSAQIAAAFGMNVLIHSQHNRNPKIGSWTDLEDLFIQSDVLSVHGALTKDNVGLVDLALIEKMKPTSFIINTSRGAIINEVDLAYALNNDIIAGAGLDVLSKEPPPEGHPLIGLPNCIITPHVSWVSIEARQRLMKIAWSNLNGFIHGSADNVLNG